MPACNCRSAKRPFTSLSDFLLAPCSACGHRWSLGGLSRQLPPTPPPAPGSVVRLSCPGLPPPPAACGSGCRGSRARGAPSLPQTRLAQMGRGQSWPRPAPPVLHACSHQSLVHCSGPLVAQPPSPRHLRGSESPGWRAMLPTGPCDHRRSLPRPSLAWGASDSHCVFQRQHRFIQALSRGLRALAARWARL